MTFSINPMLIHPQTFPEIVAAAIMWSTLLACVCAGWLLIEEIMIPRHKQHTEERSIIYRLSCKYLTIFMLALVISIGALHFSPAFNMAVSHFFDAVGLWK